MDDDALAAYAVAIGERLVIARTSRGVTQEDLAAHCRVTRRVLYNWEKGRASPPAALLGMICTRLNCSADWLVGDPHGEDAIPLLDRKAETVLLQASRVDSRFDHLLSRLATVAHPATIRLPTIDELRDRLTNVRIYRETLLNKERKKDGKSGGKGGSRVR